VPTIHPYHPPSIASLASGRIRKRLAQAVDHAAIKVSDLPCNYNTGLFNRINGRTFLARRSARREERHPATLHVSKEVPLKTPQCCFRQNACSLSQKALTGLARQKAQQKECKHGALNAFTKNMPQGSADLSTSASWY
jgi:hypothetical protein